LQDGLPEIYDIPPQVVNNVLFYEPDVLARFDPEVKLDLKDLDEFDVSNDTFVFLNLNSSAANQIRRHIQTLSE